MSERNQGGADWMDGRQVFFFPESRPSTVAKRSLDLTPEEHDRMTEAHVRSTLARRAMSLGDIELEITEIPDYKPNLEPGSSEQNQ